MCGVCEGNGVREVVCVCVRCVWCVCEGGGVREVVYVCMCVCLCWKGVVCAGREK